MALKECFKAEFSLQAAVSVQARVNVFAVSANVSKRTAIVTRASTAKSVL